MGGLGGKNEIQREGGGGGGAGSGLIDVCCPQAFSPSSVKEERREGDGQGAHGTVGDHNRNHPSSTVRVRSIDQ